MRACVCVSVFLSVHVFVPEKKLNNLRWNERILLTFLGSVQLCIGNIWAGNSNQLACRYGPRPKITCFFNIYHLPKFLSYSNIKYLGLKTKVSIILIFGVRHDTLGSEQVCTRGNYFWNLAFLHRIDPTHHKIKF